MVTGIGTANSAASVMMPSMEAQVMILSMQIWVTTASRAA
jgi:hypothetical protein